MCACIDPFSPVDPTSFSTSGVWVSSVHSLAFRLRLEGPIRNTRGWVASLREGANRTTNLLATVTLGRPYDLRLENKNPMTFAVSNAGQLQLQHLQSYNLQVQVTSAVGLVNDDYWPFTVDLTPPVLSGELNRGSGDDLWMPLITLSDPESGIDWQSVEFALVRTTLDIERDLLTPWFPYVTATRAAPNDRPSVNGTSVRPSEKVDWRQIAPLSIELVVRAANLAGNEVILFTNTTQQQVGKDETRQSSLDAAAAHTADCFGEGVWS